MFIFIVNPSKNVEQLICHEKSHGATLRQGAKKNISLTLTGKKLPTPTALFPAMPAAPWQVKGAAGISNQRQKRADTAVPFPVRARYHCISCAVGDGDNEH
jgi:hypothetical protein